MNAQVDEQAEDAGGGAFFLANIPRILWERKLLVAIPLIIGLVLGLAAAMLIKPTYQSRAMMLVESQDVPQITPGANNNNDGDQIDRRMAKIREQILSRPDLVELIQTYNLYDASSQSSPLSTLVDRVRTSTDLSAVNAGIAQGNGRNQSSIAFALSFNYPRADLAQAVAQSFVDRLLKLDASGRVSETQNSVNLLEGQQETLQEQLSTIEGKVNSVTGANGLALSAAAGASAIGGGGNYETQIASLQQQNAQLRLQLGSSAIDRDASVVAAEQQLAVARAQFSDTHPDVALAQKRVDAARRAASAVQQGGVSSSVQQQIASNSAMIGQLSSAMNAERARTAQVSAAQSRGPEITQQISQLQAQADLVRQNLGRVSSALLGARSAAQLATEQRGERLTLIDPPVTPDKPSSPNRPLLVVGGLLAGAAIGVFLALGLELLFRPIRGVGMLTSIVGVPPLSVVPVLKDSRR